MSLGKIKFFFVVLSLLFSIKLYANEKISTVPLINLENLKPSFEEEEIISEKDNLNNRPILKDKKSQSNKEKMTKVNLIGLDKITAKTSNLSLKLGEIKRFGLLEIKVIKCGKVESEDKKDEAAYIQVKDVSDTNNEKIFVFNGWTFSSTPYLQPLDHPVYDIWLVSCENV